METMKPVQLDEIAVQPSQRLFERWYARLEHVERRRRDCSRSGADEESAASDHLRFLVRGAGAMRTRMMVSTVSACGACAL